MKKGLTEMVFILDKSGSMHGFEKDTVGGFNSLIEKQRGEKGEALVSTVLFNDTTEILYDRVPLDKIEPMTEVQYQVQGCTALLDALGGAIHHIGNVHKYAREEDVPEHTIFVITTDGMENASRMYNGSKIKNMVTEKQSKCGWEFLFLGANIDSFATAESFGIPQNMTANYRPSHKGMEMVYCAINTKMSMTRNDMMDDSRDWALNLDLDDDDE